MRLPKDMTKTAILVEAALMVALAFVLSMLKLFTMPMGGTVTPFSILPLLLFSFRHGGKWGMAVALGYSFLQAMQGLGDIMLVPTLWGMALCVLLDYVFPYVFMGLAGPLAHKFTSFKVGVVVSVLATGLVRLASSFLSGIILWGAYAPEGTPVWLYSLLYNASWSMPDTALALVAFLVLCRVRILHLTPEKQFS